MRKRFNVEAQSHTGKFLTIILLAIVISVGSIFTVVANTLDCTVVDGADVYEFSLLSPDEDSIIEEALEQGMQPLSDDDYIITENLTLTVKRSLVVSVDLGETMLSLQAIEGDVLEDILQNNGIDVTSDDMIDIPLDTVITENIKVNIAYYTPVTVIVDGHSYDTISYGGTVSDVLEKLAISVSTSDIVTPSLDSYLEYGSVVTVQSNNDITVIYENEELVYSTFCLTVEEFFEDVNITIGEFHEVSTELDSLISDGMEIAVDLVTYEERTETQSISFDIIKSYSDNLYVGETAVTTMGVNGEKEVVYSDKYVNGEYIETLDPVETVTVEPVSKVITYGTKEKSNENDTSSSETFITTGTSSNTFIDFNGDEVSYSSVIVGECTAYTATGNPTSLGGVAQVGVVAVDPSIIPYGTKMYITSGSVVYGYAIAGDTGGALLAGNVMIDLYYDTEEECITFGRRDMTIYFLD